MKQVILIAALAILAAASAGHGQSTALPLLSRGQTQVAVSIQGGFTQQTVAGDRNRLYLALARPSLGLWQTLDIFALVGVMKHNIDFQNTALSNFDSKNATAYGGGLAGRLPARLPYGLSVYVIGQVLTNKTNGKAYEKTNLQTSGYRKSNNIAYTWRQIQTALFVSKKFGLFEFFGGGEFAKDRLEHTTTIALENQFETLIVGHASGLYFDHSRVVLSLGVNIHLPGQHQLGLHLRGSSRDDVGMFVGLGQTGSPD